MPWKSFINFILALLTFACIIGIGGGIAEKSVIGVILSIVGVIVFMGVGFTLKRKFSETKQG